MAMSTARGVRGGMSLSISVLLLVAAEWGGAVAANQQKVYANERNIPVSVRRRPIHADGARDLSKSSRRNRAAEGGGGKKERHSPECGNEVVTRAREIWARSPQWGSERSPTEAEPMGTGAGMKVRFNL